MPLAEVATSQERTFATPIATWNRLQVSASFARRRYSAIQALAFSANAIRTASQSPASAVTESRHEDVGETSQCTGTILHCFDRATVRFAVYPDGTDGPRVLAEISEDTLRAAFGVHGGPDSLVQACDANYPLLEKMAVYRFHQDPGNAILLSWSDLCPASLQTR